MPAQPSDPAAYGEEIPSGARGAHPITGVATSITAFLGRAARGPVDEPIAIDSLSDFERIFGGLWAGSSLGYAVRDFYLNGGRQAVIVRLSAADGGPLGAADVLGSASLRQGLFALEKTDLFNLLCIPPDPPDVAGDLDAEVIAQAAAYCERRRAMLLLDPPSAWQTPDAARRGIAAGVGTASPNAALFFPRLRQLDPSPGDRGDRLGDFAPCGAVAGVFARTDAQRGVWTAPAGMHATLLGVPALSVAGALTDAEIDELAALGVNSLRAFPAVGPVVWGARTLQGDDRLASEWTYIPVRRVALYLEESLSRGTRWAVFEPNGEPLWTQLRLDVGDFLQGLFRQGAFQGQTPQQAYLVRCDRETTSQDDVDRGIVNIVVGFAPLKPAEFVIVRIQQLAGRVPPRGLTYVA